MRIRIEHRLGADYNLVVPSPESDYPIDQHGIRVRVCRIARQSLDALLSRLYTHTLRHCVRREHVSADTLYWYADVFWRDKRRDYALTLAVCAAPGYITRRLHYLYRDGAIERSDSSRLWVAYTRSDVITSESITALLRSLSR